MFLKPKLDPSPPAASAAQPVSPARAMLVGKVLAVLLTVLLIGLFGRVYQLQALPGEQVASRVNTQTSAREIAGRRGAIYDRRGRLLAGTRVAQRMFADSGLIEDPDTFPMMVSYSFGYNRRDIEGLIESRPGSRYIVLDERLRDERLQAYQEFDIPGLATEPVLVRDYPFGSLAGQVLGFVGTEGDGLSGAEMAYDQTLAASQGRMQYLRDASLNPLFFERANYLPQQHGQTVRLSIDVTLQAIAEAHLARTVEHYMLHDDEGNPLTTGQVVLMDPHTGEILAMANYPAFEPARFREMDPEFARNRCVTDFFEPGSIFKPFIWAGLTQLGASTPDEVIDCEMGAWITDFGRRLRDSHGYGELSWAEVLVKSSNIGMGKIAMRLTLDDLHRIVTAFGFGRTTGSRLPGEVPGMLNPRERWNEYSQTSIPMGQEIGTTPLQLVRAFSVFANDGMLITPTLRAVNHNTLEAGRMRQRVLDPQVAQLTRDVMRQVVEEGTGRRVNTPQYALFGKTGTAQLPDAVNGGYHQDRYVASFVAGAPYESPRLVIGVFVHDPNKAVGHYGGIVAAPCAQRILEESLLYLGVPPAEPYEQLPDEFLLMGLGQDSE